MQRFSRQFRPSSVIRRYSASPVRSNLIILYLVRAVLIQGSPDRLRTIISYDRILVLDSGNIAVSFISRGWREVTHRFCPSGIRHAAEPFPHPRQHFPRNVREKRYHGGGDRKGTPQVAGLVDTTLTSSRRIDTVTRLPIEVPI